jgi:AcrR family transcriptional regulator
LIAVAERLFAERGVEAVSLREIGKAANSRNTAVAHYHFGNKEGLVQAIVQARAADMNVRRRELLNQAQSAAGDRPLTVEEIVPILFVPLVEELDRGTHYVGFLGRLSVERHQAPWTPDIVDEFRSWRDTAELLRTALPGLDSRRFSRRRGLALQLVLGALTARQAAESVQRARGSRSDLVTDLFEAVVGLLVAPVGPHHADPRVPPVP